MLRRVVLLIGLIAIVGYTCDVRPRPLERSGLYIVDGSGAEWEVLDFSGTSASFYMPEFDWVVHVQVIKSDDPRYEQPWQFTRIDPTPSEGSPPIPAFFLEPGCQGEPVYLADDGACIDEAIPEHPDPSTLPWQPVSPFGTYQPNTVRYGFNGIEGPDVTIFSAKIGDNCLEISEPFNTSSDARVPCGIKTLEWPADWQGVPPEPYFLKFDRRL
ncbi:MAG: hypothetical protein WAU39_17565 [Polyangiales bacterium]